MPRKGFFALAFFLWAFAVGLLSLLPLHDMGLEGPQIPYFDKWVHLGFYLAGMVLGSLFLWEQYRGKKRQLPSLLTMAAILFFYGMVIEVLQGAMGFQRSTEVWDLVANTLGIFLGGVIMTFVFGSSNTFNWRE
ncbi:VanZ family protein [Robiginitalea marina]|uniref:VanZ family protein n=1 Tax=Robiginitalea marina TaxID=2954105 RepID=A0ABT1B224_9FLAO|nr:VanZ family protein [Robiginitalea marina]